MDIANMIHRVLENKQSHLELHLADGAPFYFTYNVVRYFNQCKEESERCEPLIHEVYLWQVTKFGNILKIRSYCKVSY